MMTITNNNIDNKNSINIYIYTYIYIHIDYKLQITKDIFQWSELLGVKKPSVRFEAVDVAVPCAAYSKEFMNVGAISACHHWDFAVHLLEMTCEPWP